jgi:hypothetical protein
METLRQCHQLRVLMDILVQKVLMQMLVVAVVQVPLQPIKMVVQVFKFLLLDLKMMV